MVCSGLAGVDLAAVKRQRWVDNSGGVERRSHYNARYLHRWISTYNIHAHLSSSVVVHTTRSSIWLVSIVRVSRWRADDRDCDDDTADTAHLLLSRCHNSQQCHVSRVTIMNIVLFRGHMPPVLCAAKLWLLIRPHVTSAPPGGG